MQLLKIYTSLESHFGPQKWWPVTEKGSTEASYKKRSVLSAEQKLEICLGAILAQNTSWQNVSKAISALKKAKMISIAKIAACPKPKLGKLIKPAGYFNQKSGYLKNFCKFLAGNYNSDLSKFLEKPLPELRHELLSIKGIGPETADSILLYAAQKPSFVVDAYTKRIVGRLGIIDGKNSNNGKSNLSNSNKLIHNYNSLKHFFESNLPSDARLYNEFHALLVEHAKVFCRKNEPLCGGCPLLEGCDYGQKQS